MTRAWLLATLTVLLGGAPVIAVSADSSSSDQGAAAFAALRRAATQIPAASWVAKQTDDAARARVLLSRIGGAEADLERRFVRSGEASPAYVITLNADAASTERAKFADDHTHALSTLVAVNGDLATKIEHSNVAGAATSLGNDVPVTVRTTTGGKDAKDAPGYLVRLNCRADEDAKSPEFIFNDPSTPTSSSLAPGNYVLWLEKGGKQFSRRYVTIKSVKAPTLTIIVDVVP